jgi:DNA-binding TFAR19-related protein (PDSD5 family)
MLRRTVLFSGLLVVLAAATAVQAQDRRPGGGRGGFGFGGPGGGFFATSDALLGMPEVQKELGVSDEQKGLIEDMVADIREKRREAFTGGGFQDFQNLSQEERQKRMEEGRKKGEEIQKKADDMVSMILEPNQLDRLQQLRLQREGVGAFSREEIAKKLALSDEQRDKIRKIGEEAFTPPAGGGGFQNFQNLSEDERREARNRMRERMEKMNSDILAVLTPDQKATWEKMQGKQFDFPAPRGFGGGGGGRRPGGDR